MQDNKKELKIVQVASGDLWAGAEVQLFHMVVALKKLKGISIQVVLLNHGMLERELLAKDIPVVVFDESANSTLSIIRNLRALVKKTGADVIHSHRFKENIIAGIVAKLTNCKSIRTIHGDVEIHPGNMDFRQRLIRAADRFVANHLQHKLVCVSDELVGKFASQFRPDKLLAINNSVDPDYIQQRALQQTGLVDTSGTINIGFVGRFVEVKRVDLFYQVAKRIIKANAKQQVNFYMLGDGPLLGNIKQQIEQDNLESHIHLIGFVENSAPYLKQFDYLLFTSKHEGLPMTLLEAMALNTPVISTNLATLKQALRGNDCGYFCDSDDPDDLALYVQDVIKDSQLAQLKSQRANEILQESYSVKNNASRYYDLYQELTLSSAYR